MQEHLNTKFNNHIYFAKVLSINAIKKYTKLYNLYFFLLFYQVKDESLKKILIETKMLIQSIKNEIRKIQKTDKTGDDKLFYRELQTIKKQLIRSYKKLSKITQMLELQRLQ